jgi:hypothetical protein
LGGFYFFPWLLCFFFYFSSNSIARFAGIVSGVLVALTAVAMTVSFATLGHVPFFTLLFDPQF